MLTLYQQKGAICAQKVRVCLAEKGLSFTPVEVDGVMKRSAEYLRLNPGGYVPTLIDDGRVIPESRVICEYLDDAYPEPPLMPATAYDRAKVRLWTKQIDDTLHLNVFALSCALIFRNSYLGMTGNQRSILLALDPAKRERTEHIIEHGEESHHVDLALRRFARLADDMEEALARTEWLAGSLYSLADADFTPYLQRLDDLGLDCLWAGKSHLIRWWGRVRARPSFPAVVKNWLTLPELERASAYRKKGQAVFGRMLPHIVRTGPDDAVA